MASTDFFIFLFKKLFDEMRWLLLMAGLVFIYFSIILPMGIVFQICKRDILAMRKKKNSYFHIIQSDAYNPHFERMF